MKSRVRIFPEQNYLAVMKDGITTRFQIEDEKPITEIPYPEFYDVKITNKCSGNCPWCYQDSKEEDEHYEDVIEKTRDFFEPMTINERPFQVALGGGNPNEHPDFIELLMLYNDLSIVPNYTTNGVGIDWITAEATKELCGGVAVSCHEHLQDHWEWAVELFHSIGVNVINLHLIVSDRESIDVFNDIYWSWLKEIKYFVLLPYRAMGRASEKAIDFEYLSATLNRLGDLRKVAFGAGFYDFLLDHPEIPTSLYPPEIFSKYLDMGNMKLYKSSFDLTEWRKDA